MNSSNLSFLETTSEEFMNQCSENVFDFTKSKQFYINFILIFILYIYLNIH